MYRTLRKNIMKEITHHKYSLFFLKGYERTDNVLGQPLLYIGSYLTLENAQSAQKEFEDESIIIPTY